MMSQCPQEATAGRGPATWERPPADNQQEYGTLSPTTTRNWICHHPHELGGGPGLQKHASPPTP